MAVGILKKRGTAQLTFTRIASSMGVCETMVESGRLAKDKTDRRSIKTASNVPD
jgi:hypothetical protein